MSWLDFKLGIRMLVRYPTLTVVGGLAMAFAIGAGVGTFEAIKRATDPSLPLPEGDRIVGINYWDAAASARRPTTAYDFLQWRNGLRTVQDLGAFRLLQRNLTTGPDAGEPVEVAEMSAAAFRVTRVPPRLGRTLVESDEDPRAAPVVVLGHRLWQTRFGADPAAVGRVVRLGDGQATVVGVMPEGFAFPVSQSLWTALRPEALPREPGRGALQLFGRLAPGVTLGEAQAEVTTLAARAAAEFPEHYAKLKPHVLPYAESIIWIPPDFLARAGIQSINMLAVLFLLVVCGNVALLMFARAATREREIITQIAGTVLFTAVAYVAQRQASQIASTKASFPADEYFAVRLEMDRRAQADGQPVASDTGFLRDYGATVRALERRLAVDPAVAGVTLAERVPMLPQTDDPIEVDEEGATREYRVGTAGVDLDFFDVFQTRVVSGHGFAAADLDTRANIVVVNRLLADRIFAGRNAIGRRIRYKPRTARGPAEPGPWLEIVGIVPDLVVDAHAPLKLDNPAKQIVYRPLGPASYPVYLAAHVRGPAVSFAPALRRSAADLSPALQIADMQRLDQATGSDARAWRVIADVITSISALTLFLSLAGIYAVMSFTVTRRTREIAVRVALGAQARGVVVEILRRPLGHVAAGAVLGCLPVAGAVALAMRGSHADIGTVTSRALLLVAYAMLMVGVCALACIGPMLRALRVEPTAALREDA